MKGNAATIGIVPLAGMAKLLENAAANEDGGAIKLLHEEFVRIWWDYHDTIGRAFGLTEETAIGKNFDKEAVTGLLEVIRIAMEDFDIDRADEAMGRLSEYDLPEGMKNKMPILAASIAAVDDDGANDAITDIRKIMEEA